MKALEKMSRKLRTRFWRARTEEMCFKVNAFNYEIAVSLQKVSLKRRLRRIFSHLHLGFPGNLFNLTDFIRYLLQVYRVRSSSNTSHLRLNLDMFLWRIKVEATLS